VIDITHNVDAFIAELRLQHAGVLNAVRYRYAQWVLAIHTDIVKLTPQWGGNLAANWYLDINGVSSGEQDLGDPTVRAPGSSPTVGKAPYSRGRDPAVAISLARQKGFWVDYFDRVFIHNPVEYADEVEAGIGPGGRDIRAINRVPRSSTGKVAMVYHAYVKYSMTGSALL
jgi:hypothetical protein